MAYLTKVKLKGMDFEVGVTEQGEFFSDIAAAGEDPMMIKAHSLKDLKERIEKAISTKRITIQVPITYYEGREGPRPAIITGVHATSGDYLLRFTDTGKAGTARKPYSTRDDTYGPPLSDEDREYGMKLADAARASSLAWRHFVQEHTPAGTSRGEESPFNVVELVEEAMRRAATAP